MAETKHLPAPYTQLVSSTLENLGRCGELREVSNDSIPFNGIPGFPNEFHNYVSSFTRRKSS